jgi:hypothetical protein
MACKPETTFIKSVHDKLPSKTQPHREKMHNPYRGGTADCWYSGKRGDMWVEYKFLPRIPAIVLPDLSNLQKSWLNDRYDEGRAIYVIVGCKEGGVVYSDKSWLNPLSAQEFKQRVVSRSDLAKFILSIIG